jgi:hypothetical protein
MGNWQERNSKMRKYYWRPLIPLGLAALLFLCLAGTLFSGWGYGGHWGMMHPGVMGGWHRGHMGGWGYGHVGWFFGLGLVLRLAFSVLLIAGGIWLFRRSMGPRAAWAGFARSTCASCGRSVRNDWNHCPHCGLPLTHQSDDNRPNKAMYI